MFGSFQEDEKKRALEGAPLAARMRPKRIEEVQGQQHILGEGKLLRRILQSGRWASMIFYGPPGSGKTTLAVLISKMTSSRFISVNAVSSNVAELRAIIDESKALKRNQGKSTLLFVDEIHRFNKAQQDILMPDVETGNIILIGATTQNPSFSINSPLLSRSTIFELKPLDEAQVIQTLKRALKDEELGFGKKNIEITDDALSHIAKTSNGDARKALTSLEVGVMTTPPDSSGKIRFDMRVAEESCQKRIVYYDGDGDYHYDTISAFIKSMRASEVDNAIYWLAKMLFAGEEIRFILRRILIFASEDIGIADPKALLMASAGMQACEFVGLPEAQIILGHLVTYMALAPKSRAAYNAIQMALEDVKSDRSQEVPNQLRDTHYQGAKRLSHGGFGPQEPTSAPRKYYLP